LVFAFGDEHQNDCNDRHRADRSPGRVPQGIPDRLTHRDELGLVMRVVSLSPRAVRCRPRPAPEVTQICTSVSRPVGHEQSEYVEQHHERADGERERGGYAPRAAEANITSAIMASSLSWMARAKDPMRAETAAAGRSLPPFRGFR